VSAPGWPVLLQDGPVVLRPLRLRDATAWSAVRTANERWLSPWEGRPAGAPHAGWQERHSPAVFTLMLRGLRREARAGRTLPCAIEYDGRLAGQVTIGNVVRGAFDSAYVGYWVDGRLAGRGITPTAVALLVDHCFRAVGLHRVEANVRPENEASLRVVRKLGFRQEALHSRYLHIDGDWRDHLGFALLREDVPEGVLARYRASRGA
jgi:[ribosomal protein S5]-alanine N-acetyltransferase